MPLTVNPNDPGTVIYVVARPRLDGTPPLLSKAGVQYYLIERDAWEAAKEGDLVFPIIAFHTLGSEED